MFLPTRFALKDFKWGLKFRVSKRVLKWLILKAFGPVLGICDKMAYFDEFPLYVINTC